MEQPKQQHASRIPTRATINAPRPATRAVSYYDATSDVAYGSNRHNYAAYPSDSDPERASLLPSNNNQVAVVMPLDCNKTLFQKLKEFMIFSSS
jgi:hypothetical protein